MSKHKSTNHHKLFSNFRFSTLLLFIPVITAIIAIYYVLGSGLRADLADRGNERLTTVGWQSAQSDLISAQPEYGPKFSYYKLQEGQNLAWAANHFGVSITKLEQLNPGVVVWGTTIMVPPVEKPLMPFSPTLSSLKNATVSEQNDTIYVSNSFVNPEDYTTIPELMNFLKSYNAITELGPGQYLINKPLFIQNNIRVDITNSTVKTLYLSSAPNFDITTLTFENSVALLENTSVTTYDPATKGVDTNVTDGRSFLRAYENARMDIINSNLSYLGMTLDEIRDPTVRAKVPFVDQGGVYGVSWRIGTGTYGQEIATGWVNNSTFDHNYIGAFTFGASGMMWSNNLFVTNKIYGLDPHNNSNNATIENNRFVSNGKHGFIASKECDYNVIKDNVSIDNKLHGFMLHDNSDYNVIENNVSYGNYDNYVIYASSFNTIRNNKGYNPRGSQVRINEGSLQNYIQNNTFYGGSRGVYLYDTADGVDIQGNVFDLVSTILTTRGASRVLYTGNQSSLLNYQLENGDRVVFGINNVNKNPSINMYPVEVVHSKNSNLSEIASDILKNN